MSTTVDQVSDNLAAATISDSPAAGTNGESNNAQIDAVNAIVAEGRRLYIGNLAYATDEGALNDFFKGYLVESCSIPTNPRTNRPVGYAFVDLSTATEAQRAISELSGQEILSRKVSVQLARRPDATEKTEATSGGEGASGGEGRRRATGGRGRGRGRGRGGRNGGRAPGTTENGVLPLTDTTTQSANAQNAAEGAATTTDAAGETEDKSARAPRQRGPPEDGIPSKTKVMVANLPYDLTEEKLKELFNAYNPVSAKLALRPIPRFMVKKLQARGEARKGRGFGFVSLENEEQQQKAVQEMNGKEIEGREIAVKVAIDSPGKEDADEATGVENGAAETTTDAPAEATATPAA